MQPLTFSCPAVSSGALQMVQAEIEFQLSLLKIVTPDAAPVPQTGEIERLLNIARI
jgi:hypothetical protein